MDSAGGQHLRFVADDRSYLALIKKDIHKLAEEVGLPAKRMAEMDIAVAEIASNLIKHAGGGEILVHTAPGHSITLISIDSGAGIADTARMLEDGASTSLTLGGGLGAIRRLSDSFEIYSQPGWGTILIAEFIVEEKSESPLPLLQQYALLLPKPGETACGDGYLLQETKSGVRLIVGDGLGHGPEAAKAVDEAKKAFRQCRDESAASILRHLHDEVRKTRGLVATVALYNRQAKQWRICGLGNIATRIQQGLVVKSLMAYNGIVGHSIPGTMNDQMIDSQRGQYLLFASDGLRSRWDATRYPHIFKHSPAILAAALYKDFGRQTDDMSVVVLRMN